MKLNGTEVFSRQTIVSWRLTIYVAATLIIVGYFEYNNEYWPVLSVEVAPSDFRVISSWVIGSMLLAHLVNWYSDYVGFTRWFKRNEVAKNGMFSGTSFNNTQTPLEALTSALKSLSASNAELEKALVRHAETKTFSQNLADDNNDHEALIEGAMEALENRSEKTAKLQSDINEVNDILKDLKPNFKLVSTLARFLLFGWYLALPIWMSFCGLYLLWAPATP